MAASIGLAAKLKDKETSVPDKLKLAKYFWVTQAVPIPDKYHFLLDFTCGLLVNRKKHNLTDDDAFLVWQTLEKFLKATDRAVVIKPSIVQAVTDWIGQSCKQTSAELEDEAVLRCVLECTHQLLQFPSVTEAQFESLCGLLAVTLQWMSTRASAPAQLLDLQASLLTVLTRLQRVHLNQVQVLQLTADKLLHPFLTSPEPCQTDDLQSFIVAGLLHEDHAEVYELFLNSNSTSDKTQQNHQKYLKKLFDAIASSLSHAPTKGSIVLQFLLKLQTRFVYQNKERSLVCFLLLKHFVSLIGDGDPPRPLTSRLAPELWLATVAGLLAAFNETCDLFTAGVGRQGDSGTDRLTWFCQLTEAVLREKSDPSWFLYLKCILHQNHLIVEKYLTQILQQGLVHCHNVEKTILSAQDDFLSDLVTMYMKLRRTPEMLSALLSATECQDSDLPQSLKPAWQVLEALPQFEQSLRCLFQDVPVTTLIELWDTLHKFLLDKLTKLSGMDQGKPASLATCVRWSVQLYSCLLDNASICDHRIAAVMRDKVEALVEQLEKEVLTVFIENAEYLHDFKEFTGLVSAWSAFKSLLSPKWRESADQSLGSKKKAKDKKTPRKLSKYIDTGTRLRLVLQREDKASADEDIDLSTVGISEAVELFTSANLISEANPDCPETTVATKRVDVDAVGGFKEFASQFPLISHSLSQKDVDRCAEFVIEVMADCGPNDANSDRTDSLPREMKSFLSQASVKECKVLQETLCSQAWSLLLSQLRQTQGSSPVKKKKKKRLSAPQCPETDLDILVCFVTHNEAEPPSSTISLEDIREKGTISLEHLPLLQVLEELPLEYLSSVNLRCQLGLIGLLSNLHSSWFEGGAVERLTSLLIRCLSVTNLSHLFQCIEPHELIDLATWLTPQIRKGQPLRSDDLILLETCIEAVMRDRQAMLSQSQYVRQLVAPLKTSTQDCSLRIFVCAFVVQNCHRYLSHHVSELRKAAVDIVFTVAKAVCCQVKLWSSSDSKGKRKTSKKRKASTSDVEELTKDMQLCDLHENQPVWWSVVTCLGEVMDVWSPSAADDAANQIVEQVTKEVIATVMTRLQERKSPEKVKQAELKFLQQCCHCHRRYCQLNSEEHTSRSFSFSLFSQQCLQSMWSTLLSLAKSDVADFLERRSKPQAARGDSQLSEDEETEPTRDEKYQRQSAAADIALDKLSDWPPCLLHWNHLLTAVMESCDPVQFAHFLEMLIHQMEPRLDGTDQEAQLLNNLEVFVKNGDNSGVLPASLDYPANHSGSRCAVSESNVYVLVSVWRSLVTSNNLTQEHTQCYFSHMYQSLSALFFLIQHFEDAYKSRSSPAAGLPGTVNSWRPVTRFLVETVASFLDLGKTGISPRISLYCLRAGTTFTLTCAEDVLTLQRLVNSFMMYHTNTALTAVPTVLNLVNKLVSACVVLGGERRLAQRPDELTAVVEASHSVARILLLLTTTHFKTEVAKVIDYVLAEYLMGMQKGAIHVSVKRELTRGLYKLMGVSDKYRHAALNASLPPGVKDMFKVVHQEYKKYHQYKGLV